MCNSNVQKITINTSRTTKLQLFMAYAQNDVNIWRQAVGLQLDNTIYGIGTITEVEQRAERIFLNISFQSAPTQLADRKFLAEALADSKYFLDIRLPDNWSPDDWILRLEEKQTLLKNLKEYFEINFLNSYNLYQAKCTEHILFEEYQVEKFNYVQLWIQQHLSFTADLEQATAIGALVAQE